MNQTLLKTNVSGVHSDAKRGPYITTFKGRKFYPFDPRFDDIDIDDICHALAQQCRFSGHTKEFYSVANHSVNVARFLETHNNSNECILSGLLHDASEAYLVDVPSPLKKLEQFYAYRSLERTVQNAITAKFGILEAHISVKRADEILLATEARDLMGNPDWCHNMPKLEMRIIPRNQKRVENEFMEIFTKYYKG